MRTFSLVCISLLIMVAPAWAQITLDTNGSIAMGPASVSKLYKLRVECTLSTNCGAGAPTRYGVYSLANDGHSNYGIYGIATGGANSYGVRGHASGAGTNNWAGYFSGSVYTTGTYEPSDARLKTDVRSLRGTDMLARLMQLEPRQFRYRNAQALRAEGLPDLQFPEGDHLGLLAEEVELVFPEVVIDVVHPLDDGDQTETRAEPITTKAINYIELIPVLIEAIREQQVRIDALEAALQAQGRE